jgi:glutathione transport system substrate-binding protein
MQTPHLTRRAALRTTVSAGLALPGLDIFARLAHAATPSGSLTVGVAINLLILDPANSNQTLDESATRLMLEGLLGFDKDMKMIPLLAESFSANETATEFTFHLRKGISFHDGTPFDAAAVKFNFERVADPANHLKHYSLLAMLDRVDVVDQYTAKAVLKSPFGAFLPTVAHPSLQLLSPAALRKYGAQIGRHPVGTGPFVFSSWTPDTLIVKKNPQYWQPGLPQLSTVTIRSNPEDGARLAMLEANEAEMIFPVPPQTASVITRNPNLVLHDDPSIYVNYMAMNVRKKPFDDVRVRRALNHAIDTAAYIGVVYSGHGTPLLSAAPPKVAFYSAQTAYPHDPAKAKQLLAEAGYPNGFATRLWGQNTSGTIQAMQFIQQQLSAVGVEVSVEPLEAGVLDSKIWSTQKPEESALEMYIGRWSSSTGDADLALRPLFATSSFPPHFYNVGYYSNPAVDKALEDGLATADDNKRAAAYADAQKRIWEDAAWVFLAIPNNLSGQVKNLDSAYILPDSGLLINGATFV